MQPISKYAIAEEATTARNDMQNPYEPLDQTGLVIDGLDIGAVVSTIRKQGYAVVENFLDLKSLGNIREAFNSKVPITEMRAIGTKNWPYLASAQPARQNPCR